MFGYTVKTYNCKTGSIYKIESKNVNNVDQTCTGVDV
jgi:hypothetical protein